MKRFFGIHYREILASPTTSKSRKSRGPAKTLSEQDASLFAMLKAERLSLAQQQGVPAYVIFSDATLLDMIKRRPATLTEMSTVNGVGPSKLEKYGQDFLSVMKNQSHNNP